MDDPEFAFRDTIPAGPPVRPGDWVWIDGLVCIALDSGAFRHPKNGMLLCHPGGPVVHAAPYSVGTPKVSGWVILGTGDIGIAVHVLSSHVQVEITRRSGRVDLVWVVREQVRAVDWA